MPNCNKTKLLQHLKTLVETDKPRFFRNFEVLQSVADYIYNEFHLYSNQVEYQPYLAGQTTFNNIICSFGNTNAQRIIIGAHYDVCDRLPGADDNASGVAGLLELARLFSEYDFKDYPYRIDLVAYCLEEPPYFGTELMGSYIHAKYLYDNKIEVYGMLALEMIGYFSDEPNSQTYPLKSMEKKYGNVGDYIATATKLKAGKFANQFAGLMNENQHIKHYYYKAPKQIDIVGMSDHLNYWKFNYSACMLTDTSYLRNPNYHKKTDTISTLNLDKMKAVVDAVFQSVLKML